MLDLSKLMQAELGKAANRKSQGIATATATAASDDASSTADRNSTTLLHSGSTPDASTSNSAATPEPDDASPKDSRFSMLNPFDLLANAGTKQSARQVSNNSSSTQSNSSGIKQSAVANSRITNPHQQSVPTAARSSYKYVYYGSEDPVCGHCGLHGHKTGVCQVKLCKHCGKFGHADGNCSDACPSCGRFHKNKPHGYNCGGQRCTACGLYGHFEVVCPNVPCSACGNLGHRKLECQDEVSSGSSSKTVPAASGVPAQQRPVPASVGCFRLQKNLPEQQQHQQGLQLQRKLQAIAPKYSRGLAQNPHKLSVLSRMSPADVALLLQQPPADVVMHLEAVYTHYLGGAASGGVKPHHLRTEHARQFEAAMREIAPNYLPINWHKAKDWPANSDVLRSLGVDKAQHYKQLKLQVQVATYRASMRAGGRGEQFGNVGQPSSTGLPSEQQQQQLASDEHFPPLSSPKHQGSYAAAAAVQKPAWHTPQQEQQQPVSHRESEPAAGLEHQQQEHQQQEHQQVATKPPPAVGSQQQHHNQHHHDTAAVCAPQQLPGLVAAICSSLHNMLVQLRDGQVQLEQPFADQLLHVAELAGRAKQLTDWQQQEGPAGSTVPQLQPDPATVTQSSAPAVHVLFTQGAVAAKDAPAAAAAAAAGVVASEDEDELALLGLLIG